MKHISATAAGLAAILTAGPVLAETCKTSTPVDDMTYEDAGKLYDCLKDSMATGYAAGPKRWIPKEFVEDYRNWTPASTLPANPGVHGERYLMTWVSPGGAGEYLKFAEEGVKIPAGTVIAKESFTVGKNGVAKPGPLFIMQKVAEGKSPKTADWYYMMVSPKGVPQGVNVYAACNECHSIYSETDQVAYPEEEVRASQ